MPEETKTCPCGEKFTVSWGAPSYELPKDGIITIVDYCRSKEIADSITECYLCRKKKRKAERLEEFGDVCCDQMKSAVGDFIIWRNDDDSSLQGDDLTGMAYCPWCGKKAKEE